MNGSGKMDDATRCVHTALDPEPTTGAVHIPIFQTSTYVQNDFADHKGFERRERNRPGQTPEPHQALCSKHPAPRSSGRDGA